MPSRRSWGANMFGYVMPQLSDLSQEERDRYHAAYCGLCRALGERCGQRARFGLTYDMTFLSLVLGSLYEPDERAGSKRCPLHPFKQQDFAATTCTDYAADMSVALIYHKCLDDWHDDHAVWARAYAGLLEKPYRAVREQYARQCTTIERRLDDIRSLEHAAASGEDVAPDAAANLFGALLGEVFAYGDDFWADGLRVFGAKLGKFVYVMDAAMDMDEDRASGSYNPLVTLDAQPQDVAEDLQLLAADVAAAFEKLPLERDAQVLRSVLYAGMWQKYRAKNEADDSACENDRDEKEARRG